MFGRFQKKPQTPLASVGEREGVLAKYHTLFRVVDDGFPVYLEVVTANPQWDDARIEQELVRRSIEPTLAEEIVTFAPMAWGRGVVEQLGVECSPDFRLHSMIDDSERDMPLANDMAYAWARAMIGLYRTAERNEVFKRVSLRSAEVNAVSNALHGGVSKADLHGCKLQPTLVHFRRANPPM